MKRHVAVGALAVIGVLVVRPRLPKLRERLMAHCDAMFERMPDTFPPKRMLRGIDEIRADTARILELLQAGGVEHDDRPAPTTTRAVHHAA